MSDDQLRLAILRRVMLESDRGCPSGFRSYPLEYPKTEAGQIECLEKFGAVGTFNYRATENGKRRA